MSKIGSIKEIISKGKFIISVQIDPPDGVKSDRFVQKCKTLAPLVDILWITDNEGAKVRLSNIASVGLLKGVDVETGLYLNCRDRNRIAIQSDILGALAYGVRNFIASAGTHTWLGDHPGTKNVFDIDHIQLISILNLLKSGKLLSEKTFEPISDFSIGVQEGPGNDNPELSVLTLAKEMQAGIDFVITHPIFDMHNFSRWLELVKEKLGGENLPIIPSLYLLSSYSEAIDPANRFFIPQKMLDRINSAIDQKEEAKNIMVELLKEAKSKEGIKGINLIAPQKEEIIPELLEKAGLKK